MNPRTAVVALLLVTAAASAEDARKDGGVFEPGVQHVCVPAADGEGWDCGTDDAPPANYRPPLPDSSTESASVTEPSAAAETEPVPVSMGESAIEDVPAPPPFLADPSRNTPYAPVEEPVTEPATAAEAVVATEVTPPPAVEPESAEQQPTPLVVHVPHDGVNGSVGPQAGSARIVAAPGATTAAEAPAPEVVPAPVDEVPVAPSSMAAAQPLGDASGFAQLPAAAFTLQLAYAADAGGFPQLVANLGLDPATCYVLRVRGAQGPTWLLAHGAFADVNAARAAQAALPNIAGLSAQWPRRIGALQTDITQGH